MPHDWSPGLEENSGLMTLFVKPQCSHNHLSEKIGKEPKWEGAQEP